MNEKLEKFEKFKKLEEIEKQFDNNMDYLEDELKKIYDKNDLSQFAAPLQNNEFKAFLIEKNFKTLYNILTPKIPSKRVSPCVMHTLYTHIEISKFHLRV